MTDLKSIIRELLRDVVKFAQHGSGVTLRQYQEEVAWAIIDSVREGNGLSFVIIFPRQSGKNELQAQIEAYLLLVLSQRDAELVKASPTWKPQSLNAMRRLERVLSRNLLTRDRWSKESGYIYRVGLARIYFLSGGQQANVVGATANILLECDEAQDIEAAKWDKDFAPMAASTNATRVFWGTAWTSKSLLARERRAAEAAEAVDGRRRVWVLSAEDVAREVPAYGKYVADQVAKLGRNHPMVRTQYFSEEIDSEGGMFPPERIRMMKGNHYRIVSPDPGHLYAFTIDVAGEDEAVIKGSESLANPARDSTALTIFEVDLSNQVEAGGPLYRVCSRHTWVGWKHTALFNQIKYFIDAWSPRYVVIDSTGIGQGLASFLEKSYPGRVIPYLFTSKSKSDLGWKFLAVIETGRYKDFLGSDLDCPEFWLQLRYTMSQVKEGPGQLMSWGVPDGTRSDMDGEIVHDDLVLSAALCAVLDEQDWGVSGAPAVVHGLDPLMAMDGEGF